MRILFICRFLPHPKARDSGRQDQYHYIESLSRQHQVSLIAFTPAEEYAAIETMEAICEHVIGIPYKEKALFSRLWRLGWRILLPKVYGRVFSLPYRSALKRLLRQTSFDVVIVDGMMSQYGLMVTDALRILDEIDIYSVVAHTVYRQQKRPLPRVYTKFDWLRTMAMEMHNADQYDGVLVRSQKDLFTLQNFLPQQKIAVLPPWFEGLDELQTVAVTRPTGNKLLFSGAMNFLPNVEAVVYFANRVFPLIKNGIPDTEFYIVGNSPVPEVKALAQIQGVIVTGEVESLRPYYEMCAVNVVPLFTGGGVIVKTLNGLASGRPTVVTIVGNSGTGARPGRDLLVVSDEPEKFAQAIGELLIDKAEWQRYAHAGRQFIKKHYDWDRIMSDLAGFLDLVAQN